MSVTPLAVAEVTQRGRRKPTSLTLDLAGVRAAIAELQRAERVLLAAQAAADAPQGEASAEAPGAAPAEAHAAAGDAEDMSLELPEGFLAAAAAGDAGDCKCGHEWAVHWEPSAGAPREGCAKCEACPHFRAAAPGAGEPTAAAGPDGQDPPGPAARDAVGHLPGGDGGQIRQAEMLDSAGGRRVLVWGDPLIDEVLAAGGTLVRTFDVLTAGIAARERTVLRSHPELFLVSDGKAAAAS